MALLTYILILHLLNSSLSKTCVVDNTPDYITWEKELLKDLRSDYNAFRPPAENVVVNITFFLKAFTYDDKKETITMKMSIATKWNDGRLKWDPAKHHGINETNLSRFNVWFPYFGIATSNELHNYLIFYDYELKSNGDILCLHKMIVEMSCSVILTNWPRDLQECSGKLESLKDSFMQLSSVPKERYTINFDSEVLEPNSAEWKIYDFKHVLVNSTKNHVKLTIFLMREAVGLSAIIVWPAFVLTVLSVLSLCLDVRRKVRLAIICLSLYGHYYFLKELSYDIPKETHNPPTLLLYYRGSLVLSIIIVFSTFFLETMCKLKSTPPNYVKLINDFVYENKYKTYFVFPRWDFDDATVDSKSSSEDWVTFANIVNSVFIFIVVFSYIGLYVTNIPTRTIEISNFD